MNNFIRQGFLAIAVASLFSSIKPAIAASDTCWMLDKLSRCTTNSVSANSQGHFVHIDISPYISYSVVDSNNGVVVYSGKSGLTGTRKTINGLYSRYHIKAQGRRGFIISNGFATINNN